MTYANIVKLKLRDFKLIWMKNTFTTINRMSITIFSISTDTCRTNACLQVTLLISAHFSQSFRIYDVVVTVFFFRLSSLNAIYKPDFRTNWIKILRNMNMRDFQKCHSFNPHMRLSTLMRNIHFLELFYDFDHFLWALSIPCISWF